MIDLCLANPAATSCIFCAQRMAVQQMICKSDRFAKNLYPDLLYTFNLTAVIRYSLAQGACAKSRPCFPGTKS